MMGCRRGRSRLHRQAQPPLDGALTLVAGLISQTSGPVGRRSPRGPPRSPKTRLSYTGYRAMSNNTSGGPTATRSRVRAAPDGSRRPCSQSSNVRAETPSNSANSRCDIPTCTRAAATGESSTSVRRAASPRFICSTEARRSAWNFAISSSIFDAPFQPRQELHRQVVELRLRVSDEQPDGAIPDEEVDDPRAAPLPSPTRRPTHLPAATAPRDEVARLRIGGDSGDELLTLPIRPDRGGVLHEHVRLGDRPHATVYGSAVHAATARERSGKEGSGRPTS